MEVSCGTNDGTDSSIELDLGSGHQPPIRDLHGSELLPTLNMLELEKLAIKQALLQHEGNRTHAAKALGICIRTLQRKIAFHRLPAVGRTPSA